ncbi:MSHA pilin protein MshC [Gammaproteobacteria bacterium]
MRLQLAMNPTGGFTLIELIMTMIIIGILAVVVVPRMDISGYRAVEFHDKTMAALRYAQKIATSHRRLVCIIFPNNYTLELNIDTDKNNVCDTTLFIPGTSSNQIVSGDSVNAFFNPLPAALNFKSDGTANDLSLIIVGTEKIITVVGKTGMIGYVP